MFTKETATWRWFLIGLLNFLTVGADNVARVLIQNGVDPNAKITGGFSPLHLIAQEGKFSIYLNLESNLIDSIVFC